MERVAKMKRFFSLSNPSTESDQGRRRCHIRLRCSTLSSLTPLHPNSSSRVSRLSRCRVSRITHSRFPLRTSSMEGWYIPLQRSAKSSQFSSQPHSEFNWFPSSMILERQSTTVPKTSKVRALISGFIFNNFEPFEENHLDRRARAYSRKKHYLSHRS